MSCEHNWQYQGVVYSAGYQLAGSGAHERVYQDRYYCTKCLEVKDCNLRVSGNTYERPKEGAFPK